MSGEIKLTVIGSLTADPELRYLPSGVPVVNFTIASNPRIFHVPSGEWRDGDPVFLRCSLWRDAAENAASSLSKGDRVIATGRLVQRSWETDDGSKRTSTELTVEEIGPSLRWASARVVKSDQSRRSDAAPVNSGDDDQPPF